MVIFTTAKCHGLGFALTVALGVTLLVKDVLHTVSVHTEAIVSVPCSHGISEGGRLSWQTKILGMPTARNLCMMCLRLFFFGGELFENTHVSSGQPYMYLSFFQIVCGGQHLQFKRISLIQHWKYVEASSLRDHMLAEFIVFSLWSAIRWISTDGIVATKWNRL